MTETEFIQATAAACRRDHKSRKTLQSYTGYAARYARWLRCHPAMHQEPAEVKVSTHLGWLATRPGGCSVRTQLGALNALVFAYGKGLGKPLGRMPDWVKPPERKRLPVWLNPQEFDALCRHLTGACLTMAQVMFGAGLRLNETLKLRIRDLDFNAGLIIVRGGKGDKDRTTCLPHTLVPELRERLAALEDLWHQDRRQNLPGVWLPEDVARKFPRYGQDLPWQFVFPGRAPSVDPETGIVRRHHVHEDTLAKSLKRAAVLARLGKRITVHTLRHSFATAYLEGGGSIHKLQALLGHTSLKTTEVYTHCVRQFATEVTSPLDALRQGRANVLPFVPAAAVPARHSPPQREGAA